MRHAVLLIAAVQLPLFVTAMAARADDRIIYDFNGKVGDKGVPAPWRLKTSTGEAWLSVERPEGSGAPELALRVKSDKASFFLAHSIGARIEAIVISDEFPTAGLKLSNDKVLVMGSPQPYYWELEERTWPAAD